MNIEEGLCNVNKQNAFCLFMLQNCIIMHGKINIKNRGGILQTRPEEAITPSRNNVLQKICE